ncbi:MAG TPA: radical SAM family heme chaperone HemW [Candidatus Eisenbergiella intestinipullorum]|nr:radical SAM family heme chaperone HemW [Candidatus Eisenbergiella intestinipullorum]
MDHLISNDTLPAKGKKPLGIYLHIPFCIRKCLYCDFLSAPFDEAARETYVNALLTEIDAQAPLYEGFEVHTVFFGGGTPSLLAPEQTAAILERLQRRFSFVPEKEQEITLEANPGTLTRKKLHSWKMAGINRLSIGLQSAHNDELEALGRIHTWEEFLQGYEAARQEGFSNINIDLMSALPGQSVESWMDTLERTADLKPEHISAYSLIIEEGTPFYDWYGRPEENGEAASGHFRPETRKPLPSEDEERRMYEQTGTFLAARGYGRYEISNYALPGFACRHNLSYWERTDYAGFGLGAASLRENVRWKNTEELSEYLAHAAETGERNGIKKELMSLSQQEQMEEFMFLGLRKTAGVSADTFAQLYGKPLEEVYAQPVSRLIREGLLIRYCRPEGSVCFRLSDRGIDVSNYALAMFLF